MANVKAEAANMTKLGWTRAQTVITYVADAVPYTRRRSGMEYFAFDDFSACEPLLTAHSSPLYRSRRSAAELNWRFHRNPRYAYETIGVRRDGALFGYVVLKLFRDPVTDAVVGDVVDLLWASDDGHAVEDMLRFAIGRFHDQRVPNVETWLQTNTIADHAGAAAGFRPTQQQRYLCVDVLDSQFMAMFRPSAWFLTMADAEVY